MVKPLAARKTQASVLLKAVDFFGLGLNDHPLKKPSSEGFFTTMACLGVELNMPLLGQLAPAGDIGLDEGEKGLWAHGF